jgi:hypothetical protein
VEGDINDGDPDTFRVTFDGKAAEKDWFAVTSTSPVQINRVVFIHGHSFHDGGWFDASGGKPVVEAQLTQNGEWRKIGTLDTYPETTSSRSRGLQDGQRFELKLTPMKVYGIRVVGKPAGGDNPSQAFSSCAELQALYVKP